MYCQILWKSLQQKREKKEKKKKREKKHTNLDVLHHSFPSDLEVWNEIIPHELFDLENMPLFLIENAIILGDLDSP